MSLVKIQEAKNGAVQLSQGNIFFMVNKFLIKRGDNTGKPLFVIRINKLERSERSGVKGVFTEIQSFLLSQKQYDEWIALLIQISDRKITPKEDGEKDAS
jgi:hypothetical protein